MPFINFNRGNVYGTSNIQKDNVEKAVKKNVEKEYEPKSIFSDSQNDELEIVEGTVDDYSPSENQKRLSPINKINSFISNFINNILNIIMNFFDSFMHNITTEAVGEEGGTATTNSLGEEGGGPHIDTVITQGSENGDYNEIPVEYNPDLDDDMDATTRSPGEEGGEPPVIIDIDTLITQRSENGDYNEIPIEEEGIYNNTNAKSSIRKNRGNTATTMALGEEGGGDLPTK